MRTKWTLTETGLVQSGGGTFYLLQVILDDNDVAWLEKALQAAVNDLSSERHKRDRMAHILEKPLEALKPKAQACRDFLERNYKPRRCEQCGAEITFSRLYGDPRFCTDRCQDEWQKTSSKIGPIGPGLYSLEKEE
jgi:RNA polymerase-binding transcription factor DksA